MEQYFTVWIANESRKNSREILEWNEDELALYLRGWLIKKTKKCICLPNSFTHGWLWQKISFLGSKN